MVDAKKIKSEGVRLLEEFKSQLEGVPDTEETHYVVDLKNVWRADGQPSSCEGFRGRIIKNAPKFMEGYFMAEKGV